ncbi:MAG: DegT/DnrJ/EryC1/StrS family aminotransferase [Bacteroidia bacterium]|jgi:perosamine synthetase
MHLHVINHNKPYFAEEENLALKMTLESGYVAAGPLTIAFGNAFKEKFSHCPNISMAHCVTNGTSALYMALYALDVKNGDEIIVPTYTCSAVLNAVNLIGGKPILCDNGLQGANPDIDSIKNIVNIKTKAIIITHTLGFPVDVDSFKVFGIPIIEDCCQALGAIYDGMYVGNRGDIAVYSFYASKMISTGYGGMVITKNKNYANRIDDYLDFDGRVDYKPRFNFKLSDLQAAVGICQLNRFDYFIEKRKSNAQRYEEALKHNALVSNVQAIPRGTANNFRFILIFNSFEDLQKGKNHFDQHGITTILPIEPFELLHRYLNQSPDLFPHSEKQASTYLSIPIFPALLEDELKRIEIALLTLPK